MPICRDPEEIAHRIRRLCTALTCTLKEVADTMGVHPVTIRRWAIASHVPTIQNQRVLEQLERLHADKLARLSPSPRKDTP